MNRVRQYGDKFQVLITPHHRFHVGLELMLGNWTDPHFSNFRVETYNSWEDAMDRAYQFPDINWDQLILYHKDIFAKIYDVIKYEISVNNFDISNCTIEPRLLNPYQAKNIMFDRVLNLGDRFRLAYNMNDIISFHITNIYTANLEELAEIFSVNQALRIIYKTQENGIIKLVGKTDLGTSYEIILSTTLVAEWRKWAEKNYDLPDKQKIKKLKETLEQQKLLDKKQNFR
jgi:hypothetical protein